MQGQVQGQVPSMDKGASPTGKHNEVIIKAQHTGQLQSPWSGRPGLPIPREEVPQDTPQIAVTVGLGHDQGFTPTPGALSPASVPRPLTSMSLHSPHNSS